MRGGIELESYTQDKGQEPELLTYFFALVVSDVVSDFVAEDGGEAVFAGAEREDAAEDEDFASARSLNLFIQYCLVQAQARGRMLHPPWQNKSILLLRIRNDLNLPAIMSQSASRN